MRNLTTVLVLFITCLSFGQKEIKIPELDFGDKVYTLKFNPDPQNKQVISAYMKGTTEKDSLMFWAEGTIFTQNIMVTVFTDDKNDEVKIDIVKNHWEDSKITGQTKDGAFQESFDTAGKFGIVITSETPNIPFYLAVWTSGVRVPNMNSVYRPVSYQNPVLNSTNSVVTDGIQGPDNNPNNILMYLLIGALIVIILLLAFMVFRKNRGQGLTIFLLFFLGQQLVFAGAGEFSARGFGGVGIKYPGVMDIVKFANKLPDMSRNARRYLDDEYDLEGEANVGSQGGPGIPSSCIPDQFQDNEDGQEEDGRDGRDGIDGMNGMDGMDGIDGMDGNNGDGNDGNNGTDGNNGFDGNDGNNGLDGDDGKYKPQFDDLGRPKYDKNGVPINYDNSKYPKYDKNGKPINYGDINSNGNFDSHGRPRYDKNNNPIEYDERDRPKYDSKGNPINYNPDDFVNPPKRNKDSDFPVNDKKNPEKDKKRSSVLESMVISLELEKEYQFQIINLTVIDDENSIKPLKYAQASMLSFISTSLMNDRDRNREEGCDCLESEYKKLNDRRMNLERLRIIYAHAMKKINAGIAFGDGVSAVHGVSALVWQKQKMIILKESIPTLNKAYDDKYAEMIEALGKNLRKIDQCEVLLGNEDWYNHAGFIYYQFIADKYKRN